MSKRILLSMRDFRMFSGLDEASEALGVTPVAVSKAVKECRECQGALLRWVERMYAVKVKGGGWVVAGLSGDNRRYVAPGDMPVIIKRSDVEKVKEITPCWYGTEFAGGVDFKKQ